MTSKNKIIEKMFDILKDAVGNKVYYIKGTCDIFYNINLIKKVLTLAEKEHKKEVADLNIALQNTNERVFEEMRRNENLKEEQKKKIEDITYKTDLILDIERKEENKKEEEVLKKIRIKLYDLFFKYSVQRNSPFFNSIMNMIEMELKGKNKINNALQSSPHPKGERIANKSDGLKCNLITSEGSSDNNSEICFSNSFLRKLKNKGVKN